MATILRSTLTVRGEIIHRHFLALPGSDIAEVSRRIERDTGVPAFVVAHVPYYA